MAVALLGFSLVKHLRKAQAAEEAGLFDPSDKRRPAAPAEEQADNGSDSGSSA